MGILKFGLMLSSLIYSSAFCIPSNTMVDQAFMTMSDKCWVSPGQTYGCDYIPIILTMDPDSQLDLKKVCDTSFKENYTNKDFAGLINSRLSSLGLSTCQLSVMKGYGTHLLRDQCPKVFNEYCKIQDLGFTDEDSFLQMNNMCQVASSAKYGCRNIPFILDVDPDKSTDLKTICDESRTSHFNNDQLAALVNAQLQKYNLSPCRISVLNNLGSVQLKDQCPTAYKNFCSSMT